MSTLWKVSLMKKFAVCAAVLAAAMSANTASAVQWPADLTLDTATSSLTITIGIPLLGQSSSTKLLFSAGDLDTLIDQSPGDVPPPLSIEILDGSLTVVSPSTINVPILGTQLATGLGLSLGPGGPYAISGGVADLGGLPVAIDAGTVGTLLDFGADPLAFTLPSPTNANVTETGGGGVYTVNVGLPAAFSTNFTVATFGLTLTIDVGLTGQLNYTGTKVVPEPGSVALLGVGGIGLALAGIRRYRRRSA
jgi:hypothetical protein